MHMQVFIDIIPSDFYACYITLDKNNQGNIYEIMGSMSKRIFNIKRTGCSS